MKNTKKYNSDYYQKKKKDIARYKAEKYKADKEYRERALKNSKLQASLKSISSISESYVITTYGAKEKTFTLGELAPFLNKSPAILYRWRSNGVIPDALFIDKRKRALYTNSQALYLEKVLDYINGKLVSINYVQMGYLLNSVWKQPYSYIIFETQIRERGLWRKEK